MPTTVIGRRAFLRASASVAALIGAARLDALGGLLRQPGRIGASTTWYLYFSCTATPTQDWHTTGDWWSSGNTAIDYDAGSGVTVRFVLKTSGASSGYGRAYPHDTCDTPDIPENGGVDMHCSPDTTYSNVFGYSGYHHVVPAASFAQWYLSGSRIADHPTDETDLAEECYTAAHVHQAADGSHEYTYTPSQQVTISTKGWKWIV